MILYLLLYVLFIPSISLRFTSSLQYSSTKTTIFSTINVDNSIVTLSNPLIKQKKTTTRKQSKPKYSPEKRALSRTREASDTPTPKGLEQLFRYIHDGQSTLALNEFTTLVEKSKQYSIAKANVGVLSLTESVVHIHKHHFDRVIREFGDQGFFEECDAVLVMMKESNMTSIRPCILTYNHLISRAANWQNLKKTEQYFTDMKLRGLSPDVRIYNCLVNAYAKCGDYERASEVLNQMKVVNISPTVVTFNTLIDCCIRISPPSPTSAPSSSHNKANTNKSDIDIVKLALDVFTLMKQNGIEPNFRSFSSLINVYCISGDTDKGYEQLQQMQRDYKIVPSYVTYSSLIHSYGERGQLDRAFDLFEEMKGHGYAPNVVRIQSIAQYSILYIVLLL